MCWGFINKKGELVIEPRFAFVNSGFKGGLAGVGVHTVYPQKYETIYGFINRKGDVVIQPLFVSVRDFDEGLAVVTIKNADGQRKNGVIDKEGNFIIKPQHDFIMIGPSYYEGLTTISIDHKEVYYKNGEFVLDTGNASLRYYDDNPLMPMIVQGNKYGYCDKNNQIVIEPKYDKAEIFLDWNYGLARVKVNNKYGYIDKTGRFVVNPEFDELNYFEGELAAVKIGSKWGFIDNKGKLIIRPDFDSVHDFSDGLAIVTIGKKHGAINKIGEYVIEPKYDKLYSFSEGLAAVEFHDIMYDDNRKEWACKDRNGNWANNKDFRYILGVSEGYLLSNRKTNTNVGQTTKTTSSSPKQDSVRTTTKPVSNSSQSNTNNSSSKSGCYVATTVYGSYNCPEVWTLRRFRDNTLDATWYGRAFIKTYYAISPTLVKWFGETSWFKRFWRRPLDKLVASLRSKGVEDSPYQDKY